MSTALRNASPVSRLCRSSRRAASRLGYCPKVWLSEGEVNEKNALDIRMSRAQIPTVVPKVAYQARLRRRGGSSLGEAESHSRTANTARMGIVIEETIRAEEGVRNLLYKGKWSIIQSENHIALLPQAIRKLIRVAAMSHHFIGPRTMMHPSRNRNTTTAPT